MIQCLDLSLAHESLSLVIVILYEKRYCPCSGKERSCKKCGSALTLIPAVAISDDVATGMTDSITHQPAAK